MADISFGVSFEVGTAASNAVVAGPMLKLTQVREVITMVRL